MMINDHADHDNCDDYDDHDHTHLGDYGTKSNYQSLISFMVLLVILCFFGDILILMYHQCWWCSGLWHCFW